MSVVIHAQVRSCFAVSFRHFEFCISSQSRQRSETIFHYKRATFGSFEQRNLVSEMAEKRKTLAMKLRHWAILYVARTGVHRQISG